MGRHKAIFLGITMLAAGVTLTIGKAGTTTVRHLRRPVTACAVI